MFDAALPHDRGFTLSELLVTVAVMGVLAAISVPIITSQAENSRQAQARADVASVARLVEADLNDGFILSGDLVAENTSYVSKAGYGHVSVSEGSTYTLQVNPDAQDYCLTVVNADGYVAVQGNCGSTLLSDVPSPSGIDIDGAFGPNSSASWDVSHPYLMRVLDSNGNAGMTDGMYTYLSESYVNTLLSQGRLRDLPQQWLPNWGIRAWLPNGPTGSYLADMYKMSGVPQPQGDGVIVRPLDSLIPGSPLPE